MSDDFASRVTRQLADIPQHASKVAVFVSRSGYMATVNLGQSTVTLPFVGMYLPPAGHPVQLELRSGQLVVTGPARPLPGVGIITATGSPRATVTAWGIAYSLRVRSSYTATIGDEVEIAWTGDDGIIQGKVLGTSNVVPPLVIPPKGTVRFRPQPFAAIDSGSYKAIVGWNENEIWAIPERVGAWFYGPKIKDTIPDNAIIVAAAIYLSPRSTSGAAPSLQYHTSATRPAASITFGGTAMALSTISGWVPIPTAFIDFLKTNNGGIGVSGGGTTIFKGTQADALSGALDITWEA